MVLAFTNCQLFEAVWQHTLGSCQPSLFLIILTIYCCAYVLMCCTKCAAYLHGVPLVWECLCGDDGHAFARFWVSSGFCHKLAEHGAMYHSRRHVQQQWYDSLMQPPRILSIHLITHSCKHLPALHTASMTR